jgi:hypothetical protein
MSEKEKNRFSKPVAFNTKNEADKAILNHVKRRNFSGYVKKLIAADMKVRGVVKAEDEDVEVLKIDEPKREETAAEKMARLQEMLKQKKPSDNPPGPNKFI